MAELLHFKTFLFHKDSDKPEIRRFNYPILFPAQFHVFSRKIIEVFPGLGFHPFRIYWKDEEGDEVAISTDEEFTIALSSMKNDLKSFYVRAESPVMDLKREEKITVHVGVFCDECECNVSGIRYKCALCDNYDLCSGCLEAGCHEEHPMYRIPDPSYFDRNTIGKLKIKRHSDEGKKKRKFDKYESGPETGDESEEVLHGKHHHKKWKKAYKCPYSQMVNEYINYFNDYFYRSSCASCQPRLHGFCEPARGSAQKGATGVPCRFSYLTNLRSTLQKILDPLGITIELEVRPKGKKEDEKKNEKEKEQPGSWPSAPPEKEVRFEEDGPQLKETLVKKIEEITKILSNQTLSNENDWVSYEELKRDYEEAQSNNGNAEVSETPQPQASAPEAEKAEEISEGESLYANLPLRPPSSRAVKEALDNMLLMGFSNEGNWLSALLEAKNGDINEVLEVLSFQKKNK